MKSTAALSSVLLMLTVSLRAQGPLTPPPGANPAVGPTNALNGSGQPQATMKSLHQVEPRTPLVAGATGVTLNANGGFTITASGSYYLTGNLTVATGDGIQINTSNVTLDLSGFTIQSTNAAAAVGTGVIMGFGATSVTIRNGHIRGNSTFNQTTGALSNTGFSDGISAGSTTYNTVSDLEVSGIRGLGINVDSGSADRCVVTKSGFGFVAKSVRDCVVNECRIGISASSGLVSNCRVSTYGAIARGISGDGSLVENCLVTVSGSDAFGIESGSAPGGEFGGNVHHCQVNLTGTGGTNYGIKALNGQVSTCAVLAQTQSFATATTQGIDATGGVVSGCRIKASNFALQASVADGCFIIGGSTSITNRYNMPATP